MELIELDCTSMEANSCVLCGCNVCECGNANVGD